MSNWPLLVNNSRRLSDHVTPSVIWAFCIRVTPENYSDLQWVHSGFTDSVDVYWTFQDLFNLTFLEFKLTDETRAAITTAQEKFREVTQSLDMDYLQIHNYGKNYIKYHKLGPDSFMQLAVQVSKPSPPPHPKPLQYHNPHPARFLFTHYNTPSPNN